MGKVEMKFENTVCARNAKQTKLLIQEKYNNCLNLISKISLGKLSNWF